MFKVFKKYVLYKTASYQYGFPTPETKEDAYEIGKQNLHVRKFRHLKKALKKTTLSITIVHGNDEEPDPWNTRTIKKADVIASAETIEELKSANSMYFI